MTQPLYPMQQACVDAVIRAANAGKRAPLIVAPPAFGKTRVGVEFLHRTEAKGNRGLWVCPRRELADQTVESLYRNGAERVSVLRGNDSRVDPDARIIVASIQTLRSRKIHPDANVVVFDEARHYVANDWFTIADHYRNAYRIGLDATPQSTTGAAMGNLFDTIIVGALPQQLIAEGKLVPCRVFAPPTAQKQLASDPAEAYLRLAPNRHAVIFAASVQHAENIAETLRVLGVSARCITAKTKEDDRRVWTEEFRSGAVRVLVGMGVFVEGFDAPIADCVILARRVSAPGTLIQMCGRGMRLYPGKVDCLVLDLCGVTTVDGLDMHPDDDVIYSLEGKPIRSARENQEDEFHVRQCPECGACVPFAEFRLSVCPECGYRRPGRPDPRIRKAALEERDRKLRESRSAKLENGSACVDYLVGLCSKRGSVPVRGWEFQAFSKKYHRFPYKEEREAAQRLLAVREAPAYA